MNLIKKTKNDQSIKVIALGGQDEHGKKCLIIETNNDIYIINFGIQIPINNSNGIDMVIPNFDYLIQNQHKIRGIFINNTQDELFAGLPWLVMKLKSINIYASSFSNEVIKKRISKYRIHQKNINFHNLGKEQKIGDLIVKTIEGAGPVIGTIGLCFKTLQGDIVILSNMTIAKLDNFGNTSIEQIQKTIGKDELLALFVNAVNASSHSSGMQNKTITHLIEPKFKTNKRIVFCAYDDEMYSIHEMFTLAKKYHYPVCFYGSNIDFLFKTMALLNPKYVFPKIINYQSISKHPKCVVLVSSTWSRLYERILRIATNNDVFLKLKPNDQIIIAAPPVNGLEVAASETIDEITKISNDVLEITIADFERINFAGQDIYNLNKSLKPKYFFPVFALYRYMREATFWAIKAGINQSLNIILKNGHIANFINGKLESQNKTIKNYGDTIIDGFGVGDISIQVIKERQRLNAGGLILIDMLIMHKTRQNLKKYTIQIHGLILEDEKIDFETAIKENLDKFYEEFIEEKSYKFQMILSKKIKKYFMKRIDKEPVVVVNFVYV